MNLGEHMKKVIKLDLKLQCEVQFYVINVTQIY